MLILPLWCCRTLGVLLYHLLSYIRVSDFVCFFFAVTGEVQTFPLTGNHPPDSIQVLLSCSGVGSTIPGRAVPCARYRVHKLRQRNHNVNPVTFIGKDVATALGYSNINRAVAMHVDEYDKKTLDFKGFSQNGNASILWMKTSWSAKLTVQVKRAV